MEIYKRLRRAVRSKANAPYGLSMVVFHTRIIAPGGDVGFRAGFYLTSAWICTALNRNLRLTNFYFGLVKLEHMCYILSAPPWAELFARGLMAHTENVYVTRLPASPPISTALHPGSRSFVLYANESNTRRGHPTALRNTNLRAPRKRSTFQHVTSQRATSQHSTLTEGGFCR